MVEYMPGMQFVTFTTFEAIRNINHHNGIKIYIFGAFNLCTYINEYDSVNILMRWVRQLLNFVL